MKLSIANAIPCYQPVAPVAVDREAENKRLFVKLSLLCMQALLDHDTRHDTIRVPPPVPSVSGIFPAINVKETLVA